MLGFSNSFHYIIFTASMPSVSDIQIHTFISFTKSSLVHQYQSIRHTIFAILQQLMMDRLPKKFANLSTYLPLRHYPLPPPICSERIYVTSKPEPEPETRVWPFTNPKTRVYRRNPGLETLITRKPRDAACFSHVQWLFDCQLKRRDHISSTLQDYYIGCPFAYFHSPVEFRTRTQSKACDWSRTV